MELIHIHVTMQNCDFVQAVRDKVIMDLLELREKDRAMVVPLDYAAISPGSHTYGLDPHYLGQSCPAQVLHAAALQEAPRE